MVCLDLARNIDPHAFTKRIPTRSAYVFVYARWVVIHRNRFYAMTGIDECQSRYSAGAGTLSPSIVCGGYARRFHESSSTLARGSRGWQNRSFTVCGARRFTLADNLRRIGGETVLRGELHSAHSSFTQAHTCGSPSQVLSR